VIELSPVLGELLGTSDLKRIVERIHKLPSLSQVVTRILALARDPRSGAGDLKRVIELDPALSLKVLRLVNSSFYGYTGKIRNVAQAVVILGFDSIKSIALSASVIELFKGFKKNSTLFNHERFWLHSIGVGASARLIATDTKIEDPESLFFVGLIHDLGKMIMNQYAHEEFEAALRCAIDNDLLLLDAEMQILGTSHVHVGRWLAARWNLPEDIVDAIGCHHQPTLSRKAPQLASAVHLADFLVHTAKIGQSGNGRAPELDPSAMEILSTSRDLIEATLPQLNEAMAKAEGFIADPRETP